MKIFAIGNLFIIIDCKNSTNLVGEMKLWQWPYTHNNTAQNKHYAHMSHGSLLDFRSKNWNSPKRQRKKGENKIFMRNVYRITSMCIALIRGQWPQRKVYQFIRQSFWRWQVSVCAQWTCSYIVNFIQWSRFTPPHWRVSFHSCFSFAYDFHFLFSSEYRWHVCSDHFWIPKRWKTITQIFALK